MRFNQSRRILAKFVHHFITSIIGSIRKGLIRIVNNLWFFYYFGLIQFCIFFYDLQQVGVSLFSKPVGFVKVFQCTETFQVLYCSQYSWMRSWLKVIYFVSGYLIVWWFVVKPLSRCFKKRYCSLSKDQRRGCAILKLPRVFFLLTISAWTALFVGWVQCVRFHVTWSASRIPALFY
jgi:hypothetical protein